MSLRFAVTGLNGVTGWHLFQHARNLYGADGTFRKCHPVLCGRDVRRLDLEDENVVARWLKEVQPDTFIHAWAICDLDLCETHPHMAERINVEGTRSILKAASGLRGLKKFVFISTDHVFDGDKGHYREGDTAHPKHVYGRTRLWAERLVAASGLPDAIV